MNKKLLILIILFCAPAACLWYAYDTNSNLPEDVVNFYSSAGNFYIDSTAGSLNSFKNLMGASTVFYAPLSEEVIFAYMDFGEKIIQAGEKSMDGLAGIGSLTSGLFGISFK